MQLSETSMGKFSHHEFLFKREYAESSFGYLYNDIESFVAPRVGEIDIYRANHHGSGHSSSQLFMDTLNPQLSLISCGVANSYGHPV
jgi:beta-lactamase superfamily II metal-dependent hydrolase